VIATFIKTNWKTIFETYYNVYKSYRLKKCHCLLFDKRTLLNKIISYKRCAIDLELKLLHEQFIHMNYL
jgi:hypothetical protein